VKPSPRMGVDIDPTREGAEIQVPKMVANTARAGLRNPVATTTFRGFV
jgi:hypothetical protein